MARGDPKSPMTDHVWKHLPYAVYLDTNAVRSAGLLLDAQWMGELLSITNEYGISVCISELVLSEWCSHISDVLESTRGKLLSSARLLAHYDVAVPAITQSTIALPERSQLVDVVTRRLHAVGIDVIPDSELPVRQLLTEAVAKDPPFEQGGKGLCDAVILETYVRHAKEHLAGGRVLVVSNDRAVKRSAGRFKRQNILAEFVAESEIVRKLKALLDDEVATLIEEEKLALERYVSGYRDKILEFVRITPLEVTDWLLNPPYGAREEDRIAGTIESIVDVRPTRIVGVFGGSPIYGEQPSEDRYPIGVNVELELDVVVRDYGFGLAHVMRTRATVQPEMLDGSSPVPLKSSHDSGPRVYTATLQRNITVRASIDARKKEQGQLDDFRIEGTL